MPDEPEQLGERLRRMESEISRLVADMEHAKAATRMFGSVWEHVVMPSILLLAGHGRHQEIQAMLRRAEDEVRADKYVFEPSREANADDLAGWRQWFESSLPWKPPSHEDRHPDLYP